MSYNVKYLQGLHVCFMQDLGMWRVDKGENHRAKKAERWRRMHRESVRKTAVQGPMRCSASRSEFWETTTSQLVLHHSDEGIHQRSLECNRKRRSIKIDVYERRKFSAILRAPTSSDQIEELVTPNITLNWASVGDLVLELQHRNSLGL